MRTQPLVSSRSARTGPALWATVAFLACSSASDPMPESNLGTGPANFHVSIAVTDDAGVPLPGAHVTLHYNHGPNCTLCVPEDSAAGFADATGVLTRDIVAEADGFTVFAGGAHTVAYVEVSAPNYESSLRFVQGAPPSTTQTVRLNPVVQLAAGDSLELTIAPTDPVFPWFELDLPPWNRATDIYRSIDVRATADGVLTIFAIPTPPGGLNPEIFFDDSSGGGTAGAIAVRAGDVVNVRIATTIEVGRPAQSFEVYTSLCPLQ